MLSFNPFKAVGIIAIITIIGKVLGFLREMLIANSFGTSLENDAFLMAFTIPNAIFGLIAAALGTTLIPVFSEAKVNNGESGSLRFINKILTIVVGLSIILVMIGFVFSEEIINVIAHGFSQSAQDLTIHLFKILLPLIVVMSVVALLTGYLQANLHFNTPAMISIPMNLITAGFLWAWAEKWGISSLAWGYIAGTSIQIILLLIPSVKLGFRYKFILDFRDQHVKQVGLLIVPVIIGSASGQISVLVDRFMASGLPEGSISALHFANKLILFPHGVFIVSMCTVAYPVLAKFYVEVKINEFRDTLMKWIIIMFMIVTPITAGFIALQQLLVRVVYEHGTFNAQSTVLTATALQYYVLGLPALGLRDLLNRAFFAIHDTKTPTAYGILAIILNIFLNIVFIKTLGHGGLALATSVSSTFAVFLLIIHLATKGLVKINSSHIIAIFKFILSSFLMGVIIKRFSDWLLLSNNNSYLSNELICILSILLGIVVYFVSLIILFFSDVVGRKFDITSFLRWENRD